MPNYTVAITANICLTDAAYVEKTLRHIMRSLNYPFAKRLVAFDASIPAGTFAARTRGNSTEIEQILKSLLADGVIDRVDEIPWDQSSQEHILQKFFGTKHVDPRCISGTAVYQYLFALEQCKSDYVLHVDSDMLFFSNNKLRSWIDEAVQLMQNNREVVIATPNHPPYAQNWIEYIVGRRIVSGECNLWHESNDVSTRYFLYDRRKFEEYILPLTQEKIGERLEESLTYTLKSKGYKRYSLNSVDSWAIHPKPHNENFIRYLDELIWAIENNVYPFRRGGRYPWDLYTYDRHIRDWLKAIKHAKAKIHAQ